MNIAESINNIKSTLPDNVQLVAVSKTKPNEAIMEAYNTGHKVFGENKVQDLVAKHEALPKDIDWHFIGHLQTNKVKFLTPFVSLIHGVDSFKLLKEINKSAAKNDRLVNCLLQVHIAKEDTKFGLSKEEIHSILTNEEYKKLENIRIVGLMGMATYTNDEDIIRSEFGFLSKLFNSLKSEFFSSTEYFKEISMGMSDDYKIAIEEGSTMIRVGSSIFGARNY